MLQVFSDACFREGNMGYSATLILRNHKELLTFFGESNPGTPNITVAEILGVIQGLRWIKENCPDEKAVKIYTDNMSIKEVLDPYLKKGNVIETRGVVGFLWTELFRACDVLSPMHIKILHIYGHQEEHNPNKACDMLCAGMARQEEQKRVRSSCSGT